MGGARESSYGRHGLGPVRGLRVIRSLRPFPRPTAIMPDPGPTHRLRRGSLRNANLRTDARLAELACSAIPKSLTATWAARCCCCVAVRPNATR